MDELQGLALLPRPIWISIASFGIPATSCATSCCSKWVQCCLEVQTVWWQHALFCRYCMPIMPFNSTWRCAFGPEEWEIMQGVDWAMLVKMNHAVLRCKNPMLVVLVRLRDFDIRLPLLDSDSSLGQLQALLYLLQFLLRLLLGRGCKQRRIRLRHLEWCGRPGKLVKAADLSPGSRFLVEIEQLDTGWPLPSKESGLPIWGSIDGQPGTCPDRPAVQPRDMSGLKAHANGDTFLVRLVTPLLDNEEWLLVRVSDRLLDLVNHVVETLRQQIPWLRQVHFLWLLGGMLPPVGYAHLSAAWSTKDPCATPTLQELAWVRSETIVVEAKFTDAARQSKQSIANEIPLVGASELKEHEHQLVLEFRREETFSKVERSKLGVALAEEEQVADKAFPEPDLRSWMRGVIDPLLATLPLPNLGEADRSGEQWRLIVPNGQAVLAPASQQCSVGDAAGPCEPPSPVCDDCDSKAQGSLERIVPHHFVKVVPGAEKCRQFEFHPSLDDIMLSGDKIGGVKILSTGSEAEEKRPALQVDVGPLLGLSWLRQHPGMAVVGASNSGLIQFLRYSPSARPGEPSLELANGRMMFSKLSSVSVNCSDDYLLASGISESINIYDIETGVVLSVGNRVHEHFINISRFCQTSPHIFATASFDRTCKIWDMRQPLNSASPIKKLNTDGPNVMCCFSPDDRHFLCSGVDTRLTQFEVPSWQQTPQRMQLREPVHEQRYRRSAYLADGQHIVTAATEESHVHLLSVQGRKKGVVDFRGAYAQQERCRDQLISGSVLLDDALPTSGSTKQQHEFVQSMRAHPVLPHRFGVLMATHKATDGEAMDSSSYVAVVDLDYREVRSSAAW